MSQRLSRGGIGLASALMAVTDGRIVSKILSPTGLLAVRTLAVLAYKMMDAVSAAMLWTTSS